MNTHSIPALAFAFLLLQAPAFAGAPKFPINASLTPAVLLDMPPINSALSLATRGLKKNGSQSPAYRVNGILNGLEVRYTTVVINKQLGMMGYFAGVWTAVSAQPRPFGVEWKSIEADKLNHPGEFGLDAVVRENERGYKLLGTINGLPFQSDVIVSEDGLYYKTGKIGDVPFIQEALKSGPSEYRVYGMLGAGEKISLTISFDDARTKARIEGSYGAVSVKEEITLVED